MSSDETLLYLYSSNIRPLYEQDVLDVLAAPSNTSFRFRYDEQYINAEALNNWHALKGVKALVHFSLQQEARYHDPAFIPVRLGQVLETSRLGRMFIVTFSLGPYVSLPDPQRDPGGRPLLGDQVRAYRDYLSERGVPTPYEYSAGLGSDVTTRADTPLSRDEDEAQLFDRTVKYLHHTSSFRRTRFLRFLYLRAVGPPVPTNKPTKSFSAKDGIFTLEGGKTYELGLAHSQPADVTTREHFTISADKGILDVVGRTILEIASRYDLVTVPLHAVHPPTNQARTTVLLIEPEQTLSGPRLRLDIKVSPSTKRVAVVSAGQALAAVLIGLPAILKGQLLLQFVSLSAGTIIFALLSIFGLKRP